MKRKLFVLLITILFTGNLTYSKTTVKSNLEFVQNLGQWETPVKYKVDLHGGWLFLESNALTYLFQESMHQKAHGNEQPAFIDENGKKILNANEESEEQKILNGHVYKVRWLNANSNPIIEQEQTQSYFNNYFIGNDVSKWKTNVPISKSLNYKDVYKNIDFKIYSEDKNFKTDYVVHKDGNVNDIQFEYDGVDGISIDETGRLKIRTSINVIYELKPYAYQLINNEEKEIACTYSLKGSILTFNVSNYNKEYDLIIDPSLIFSTYSGSTADNWGSSSTNDANGNMFLGGIALASGYPTTVGAFQTTFGGGSASNLTDIVITKFNSTGTARLFSTYLGGSSNELLQSLYCTTQNELIILSTTSSTNFPTSAAGFDKTHNGGASSSALLASISFPNGADIAITKLNSAGSALIGSTFFGGSGTDGLNLNTTLVNNYGDDSRGDIAVDNTGNIYIVSTTTSTNIPSTAGRAQPTNAGSSDGVIAQFNSTLSALNWSTYYGGNSADAAYSLSLDASSNIFICGGTLSNNIPGRTSGLNTAFLGGSADGYVAKLNSTATSVNAATYLGTSSFDEAYIMDLDKNDNVYIFGQTLGAYPVSSGVYSNAGAKQFIHKLNNNLNTTSFSTVFGRTNYQYVNISPTALLVDICSNIYAVGWGGGINFDDFANGGTTDNMPVTGDAYKANTDGKDFYLINLGTNATTLKYATYFGEQNSSSEGDHVDGGTSRFDKNGVVYEAVCASCGGTDGFPTSAGAYSTTNNSTNCNMAGFKFKFDLPSLQITALNGVPPISCAPQTINFSYSSTTVPITVKWYFGDGDSSSINAPSHTFAIAGTYIVTLKVFDPTNCNPTDSFKTTITIYPKKQTTLNRSICQGQSVTVGNQTFNAQGTFVVTLQTSQQCDSVVTLNLTVNPTKQTTLNRTICQGQSVTVGTQTFNAQGTFVVTLQTSQQCDSVVTLNLTVNPTKQTTLNRVICQGQSVTVGNQTFNAQGTFVVTLQTSQQCDSVVTLNLTVNPTKQTTLNRTICQGQSVTVGNQTFNAQGTFVVTLQTSQQCDSIVTLNLIVNPTKQTTLNRVICQGQSVTVGNQTFNASGTFVVTLQTSQQCDSVVTLNLTVNPTKQTTLNRVICQGQSVTVGNQTFSNTGNFIITLQTSQQCDSVITLNLTVNPTKQTTINRTICQGQSVTVGNQTFNAQGTFVVTLQTSQQCDSVVTLNLTVNPTKQTTLNRTICQGQSVTVGNQTFNASGTFVVTLQTSQQCDSVVTLNLTVNPTKQTTLNRVICQGQSVTIGNQTFNASGTFVVTLQTSQQCDSVVTLNLTVNPTKQTTLNRVICQGQSVTVGNQTFNASGTFVVTLQTSQQCDSVVTLNLTVTARIINNITRIICQGQSVTVGNNTYSQTGNFTDTLRSLAGCDSVVNLNLTVNPTKQTNLFRTICQGQSVTVGNQTFNTQGTFVVTLQTSQQCDSVVTLNLTVNPTKQTTLNRVICQGQSVTVGNQTFNASGTFVVTLQTSQQCDSVVTLNLTVNPTKQTTLNRVICQGQSVTVGNQTFNASGTFVVTLQTSQQCDSVVTLNLTVTARIINNITRIICQGQSVTVGNNTYSQTGNFTDTLRSLAGCDSVVNLNLTVNPTKQTTFNRVICQGQSVTVGNQTFNAQGTFVVTLQTSQQCDSVVTLNLTVNPTKQTTLNRTICQGQSVTVGNQTFNAQGTFIITLQTSQQCDSVVTLNLTVNPTKTTNITRTICQGENVTIGNQVFTSTGNFTVVLQTSLGCDSTVNLNLLVNPTKTTTLTDTICQGDSVLVGTQLFFTPGTFTVNLFTTENCDSTVTLNLFVNPIKITNISEVICEGDSIIIDDKVFKDEGVYTVTMLTSLGCDSIINLTLTTLDTSINTFVITICDGEFVTVGNQTFSVAGIYTVRLQSSFGCDSTVILDLRVKPTQITDIRRIICEGETVSIGNQTFSTTGNFTVVLQTFQNCDSTVNLDLIVNPKERTNLFRIICEGESIGIGNQIFNETGNYTVVLQTVFGCDSTVNLDLVVNSSPVINLSDTICRGQTITIGNQIFSESGSYTVTLETTESCDSTINLNLTVIEPITTNIRFRICQGEAIAVGDSVYTSTGNYTTTLVASSGCDSIVVLDLTVEPTFNTNISETICDGESITIGNQTFTATGNYTVVLESNGGCDSTVNLNLTVNSVGRTSLNTSICSGQSVIVGQQTFTTSGEYTIVLQNALGCDSTVFLNLLVNELPDIVATADKPIVNIGEQVQLGITTTQTLSYNWTPADLVSNSTVQNPTATLAASTWFVVTATNGQTGCSFKDSVFVELNELTCSKENVFIPNAFTPNGDQVNDIFIPRSTILKSMRLIVQDRWGHQVFESNDLNTGWDGIYNGQPATEDSYGYYFVGECQDGEKITIKGNVTLMK